MNQEENWNDKIRDGERFVPDTVDEEIESQLSAKAPEEHPSAESRMIHDLAALEQEDAASLERIWRHLATHETFDRANRPAGEAWQPYKSGNIDGTLSLVAQRRRHFRQRLGIAAAVACILLVVGSLAFVLDMARLGRLATQPPPTAQESCSPSGNSATAPAPVVYKKEAGQSGLYVTGSQGVYRFDAQGGQPQPLWLFKMNACVPITPTIEPGFSYRGVIPLPTVTTGAAVANSMVYFGVNEKSGGYLYALHTLDGSLAWKAKVSPTGTPLVLDGMVPLVLDGMVVIETSDNAGNPLIMAFDAQNGTMRWSHPFSSSPTNQSEGLGAVGDGRVYASTSHTIFALDITTGKQVWSTDIESDQIVIASRYFDGTLYATASSTCFNCAILPGTSAAYAFNPASGGKLWESQKVAGYLSPPTESGGVVYFGSIDGSVHALHASDGKQLWQAYANGEVRAIPVVADGLVFVVAGPFLDPSIHQGTSNGQVVVLVAANGNFKEAIAFPNMGIVDMQPIAAVGGIVYITPLSYVLYSAQVGSSKLSFSQFSLQALLASENGNTSPGIAPFLTLVP